MNSKISWILQIDPAVSKTLKKIPQNYTRRIIAVIETLPQDPFAGDIQKMAGKKNVWRRRVGEYRIFFELLTGEKIIHVFHAERRTTATY
ncbi:type II toxin-antitoxin system RelE/ParE family toxin [Candidatus Daviesbacteria bacterium]|nr:type II toxin-antitoxin system RelE/ParE family toxin [Candidatus Daviesbacteria bacterium]